MPKNWKTYKLGEIGTVVQIKPHQVEIQNNLDMKCPL